MKKLAIFLIILLAAGSTIGLAQEKKEGQPGEKLTFLANIRFRYEFQDNFNQKFYGDNPKRGSSDDGFLLGRFQLGVDYRPYKNIRLYLSMQDCEAWDNALSDRSFYTETFGIENNPNKDRWELGETFLEVKKLFHLPLTFKGGRQKIAYGNNRVFGPGEWGNTGRWIWDATKLSYEFNQGFIDVYYGRTLLHEPDEFSLNHRHGYESGGLYSHFELPDYLFNIMLEPFFMTKKDGHNRYKSENGRKGDLNSYYVGLRSYRNNFKGLDYDLTFITQRGDFSRDDIKAYGYHLFLGYNFKNINFKPRLSMEYSFASGDSNPNDGDHETFDGAFGAKDRMYGRMNLFSWENLQDAQINLEAKPREWLSFKAEFHQFWLAERKDAWYLNKKEYRDKTGRSGNEVGKECDIVAKVNLPKKNEIQVGFGHFWPGEFAKKKVSDSKANWVFFQWEYKFSEKIF